MSWDELLKVLDNGSVSAVIGGVVGALLASTGWMVKRRVDKQRDRLSYFRSRSDARTKGYEKLRAAAYALHYRRACARLSIEINNPEHGRLMYRAMGLVEEAATEVRMNLADTHPFDVVTDYFNWLFLVEHKGIAGPGIPEFNRFLDLLVRSERVAIQEEKESVLRIKTPFTDLNEERRLLDAASMHVRGSDGTELLAFDDQEGAEALAQYIEGLSEHAEKWTSQRELSWVRMEMSGLFGSDLPPRV